MYEAAPQSVFTPISSSAEYIGSHVVFNAVPPTHELPLGCDVDATQQGDSLLGHFLGYDSGGDGGNDLRFTSKSGLGSQAANQRAKAASEGGYSASSSGAPNYIRCFSLLHSHIGDTGLKMNPVTDAILQMATIESGPRFPISELNLGFCSLTEESASTVISLISALPYLQKVTLVGNMFGNVINVLDNDALLGDFNASLQVENELTTTQNDPNDDDSNEDEMAEGASPLADFMALQQAQSPADMEREAARMKRERALVAENARLRQGRVAPQTFDNSQGSAEVTTNQDRLLQAYRRGDRSTAASEAAKKVSFGA